LFNIYSTFAETGFIKKRNNTLPDYQMILVLLTSTGHLKNPQAQSEPGDG